MKRPMNFPKICLIILLTLANRLYISAQDGPLPRIESCACNFKIDPDYLENAPPRLKGDSVFVTRIDSSFSTQCGYLIVPENRKKTASNAIKLPFIIVKSTGPDKKHDPVLFTAGGPGGSSLFWANKAARGSLVRNRDCIAFEQRGTAFAIPCLRRFDLDTALRAAYRNNLSKDSMTLVGLKRYKRNLENSGIDLSGYNTDETVADIHDLLNLLNIDSVNLFGGSYSGGLMLAVLQKDPSKVRALVLDSPLPTFVPIDEDEPANFSKALLAYLTKVEQDSASNKKYEHLSQRFRQYFTSIIDKKFYLQYLERSTGDSLNIEYTKDELLTFIANNFYDSRLAFDIAEIINGNHDPYVKQTVDNVFNKNIAPSGMRISVYCADQAEYHSEEVVEQLYDLYPYMKGFHVNDVYKPMCDCWNVPPVNKKTKQPFYSDKPAFIADGAMDQACSPLYMLMIEHYMPNAQCFLFKNHFHGVWGGTFDNMMQTFIDNPYNKIETNNSAVIPYR